MVTSVLRFQKPETIAGNFFSGPLIDFLAQQDGRLLIGECPWSESRVS
jgi:hypothetical protein